MIGRLFSTIVIRITLCLHREGDMTIGVYAHEMGHAVFGLPNLYDYGYDSEGLGDWSLMAGGSWNGSLGSSPAFPDAWSHVQMGYVTPPRSPLILSTSGYLKSSTVLKPIASGPTALPTRNTSSWEIASCWGMMLPCQVAVCLFTTSIWR
ncbi:immune inhibitor A domain-containing protein [Candidatus Neomarinimicrobiota bacterium]